MKTTRHPTLNAYQRLARQAVVHVRTSFLIPLLWRWYRPRHARQQLQELASLPPGTLGRGVADLLRAHHLQLIPHYEDHDLKHVLLGYGMTPEDELKLKAFTLGNGDYSLTCVGFLLMGLLLPELWPELRQHFRRGRQVRAGVYRWRLRDYAARDLAELRREIGLAA
jgi:ubiquinone biosynthesis protein Coq4